MRMLGGIRAKRDEINAIARRHKTEKPWVFGSCVRKDGHSGRDVAEAVKKIVLIRGV